MIDKLLRRTTSEYVFLNKKFEVTYIFDAYERSEEINGDMVKVPAIYN